MKKTLMALGFVLACTAEAAVPYKLGIAGYSFCRKSLDESLEIMKRIDCHYLCIKDFHLKLDASDGDIEEFKSKCAKHNVSSLAIGPLYFKDEATARKLFTQAKKLGIKTVVVVPYGVQEGAKDQWGSNRFESDEMLDALEKLVREFDIRAAIHNHGPDTPTLFPTGESVLDKVAARDARIGVCLDIGHERRAGKNPEEFIRKHGDRIYDVHIKNIIIDSVKNLAMEAPRGELDIPGILTALAEVGYDGVCHIEYEKDFADNALPLAESVGYFRGVMDSIHVKAPLDPVPEGANTLTEKEKSEGWKLLFDGKELPKDLWVGATPEWDLKTFPARGWYVRDGYLAMRPRFSISKGQWVPLPEEDRKLAGGGDIVTVKKYRDFEFSFDFRLTEAANSGVKYFYNEGVNKNSCEEYQILDPSHPDYDKPNPGGLEHVHRIAALYDLIATPLADGVIRRVGRWNTGKVVSKGKKVEHWLNGVKVLEYERGSKAFRDAVATSKYLAWQDEGKFWGESEEGRLLLQDHGDSSVSFCNLKVREL